MGTISGLGYSIIFNDNCAMLARMRGVQAVFRVVLADNLDGSYTAILTAPIDEKPLARPQPQPAFAAR